MVTEPDFQRARRPEQKRQRRDAILAAARELAIRDGVRSVSLTAIADRVGMRKSAVLRYFETREEIYLHLTADEWHDWARAVRAGIDATPCPDADALATVLSGTLAERPLFCDLLAHAPLILERHVSLDAVRAFKLRALDAVDAVGASIAAAVPALAGEERNAVAGVTALAASLWQTSHPPATLAGLYESDPRLGHAVVEFLPRLRQLGRALVVGLAGGAPMS